MKKTDMWHLGLTFVGAVLTTFGLLWGWPSVVSGWVVALVNVYLAAVLLEAALLSSCATKPANGHVLIGLPKRTWSLLQVVFLVMSVMFAFANMYVKSGEVVHQTTDLVSTQRPSAQPNPEVLTSRSDAIYFSMVTLTTLGFGDYVPAGCGARRLVVWQLATGFLLLLGAFPLLISRIAGFP